MEIGARIRKLRIQQNRTLQQIADRVGLTRSMLSKVETGKTVPAVATLTRIAEALGVKVAALIEQTSASGTVHTSASQVSAAPRVRTENGYGFYAFASGRADKAMQPYLFVARRGEVKKRSLSHRGEEFVYMLRGEMKYRVGDVEYHLRPGDSLYFDSEDEHALEPVTKEVEYLALFTGRNGGG